MKFKVECRPNKIIYYVLISHLAILGHLFGKYFWNVFTVSMIS